MNLKKLGAALILSTAFGLVACGDDSSSNSPDSSTDPSESSQAAKKEELQKKISEITKNYAEAMNDLGECTSKKADESKKVKIGDKEYKFVCDGDEWESEEFDEDMDELEKELEELSKDIYDDVFKGDGCNFKVDDDTWSYSISYSEYGTSGTLSVTYKIKGDEYEKTEKSVASGESVKAACKALGNAKTDEGVYCEDGKMITVDEISGSFSDRTEFFNKIMASCQEDNGNFDWEPDSDEDDDKPAAKIEGKLTFEDDGIKYYGTGCDFKKTDSKWKFSYSFTDITKLVTEVSVECTRKKIDEDGDVRYEVKCVDTEITTGKGVKTYCYDVDEKTSRGTHVSTCKGDEWKDVQTITDSDDYMFHQFMGECQEVNGKPEWRDEHDMYGDDEDEDSEIDDEDDNTDTPSKEEKDDGKDDEPANPIDEGDDGLNDMYKDILENPENYGMTGDEAEEYQKMMEEINNASKAIDDMGECTADREGEKQTIVLYGENTYYICKDGEWGLDYAAYGLDD